MEIDELYKEGCADLDIGRNDSAIKSLNQVLELNPEHYEAMNKLGVAYARNKDFVNAQDCFEKSLDINEDFGPAWVNLANLYSESKDLKTAEEFYLEAIKRDPDYHLSYHNLAVLYKGKGEYELYVKNMKKYKRLYKRYLDMQDTKAGKFNPKVKRAAYFILMAFVILLTLWFLKIK